MISNRDQFSKERYSSDKERYQGWQIMNGEVLPLMNPEYLTRKNLW